MLAPEEWERIGADLDASGCAVVRRLLSANECRKYAAAYPNDSLYRSRVLMERHGFGKGEYKYFDYPLPAGLASKRESLYGPLAAIANRWHEAMGVDTRFPPHHADFIARCRAAGQRPCGTASAGGAPACATRSASSSTTPNSPVHSGSCF